MARTNSPHPRSFLAFACCARARILRTHLICPPAFPAEILRQILPTDTDGKAAYLGYLVDRAERYVDCLTECERSRLAGDGWTDEAIESPQMRETLKRSVAQQCAREMREYELLWAKTPKLFEVPKSVDDGLFPRDVVVDIIAGTHFAVGAGYRSRTAKAINRGIPTKDQGKSTGSHSCMPTPTEIGSALDAFATRQMLDTDGSDIVAARIAAWNALVLNALWKRVQADSDLRSLPCADAVAIIEADGRFWLWLREDEQRIEVPEISRSRISELYRHARRVLERYAARAKMRPDGIVKIRRKPSLVSRALAN